MKFQIGWLLCVFLIVKYWTFSSKFISFKKWLHGLEPYFVMCLSDLFRLFSRKECCSVNYILSYSEILKGIIWQLICLHSILVCWHDSVSNGKTRFALFATCGMLLIFKPLMSFISHPFPYVCFCERRFPKNLYFGWWN